MIGGAIDAADMYRTDLAQAALDSLATDMPDADLVGADFVTAEVEGDAQRRVIFNSLEGS